MLNYLSIFLLMVYTSTNAQNTQVIVDFTDSHKTPSWEVFSDGVMGGVSESVFTKDAEGSGIFSGHVSTDNNGGFAGVRCRLNVDLTLRKRFVLHLTGDSKSYQFRIKHKSSDAHSYVYAFETSGEKERIVIDIDAFIPRYRGRDIDRPNFNDASLEEICFLIGNKVDEDYRLQIHKIEIE